MIQAPPATEIDMRLVKESILFPLLMDILEKDIQTLSNVKLRAGKHYISSLRRVQDRIHADLALLRTEMYQRGLKVYEQQRKDYGIEAKYLCRGYHQDFRMLMGFVNAELSRYMSHYLNSPGEPISR
jgi:hypothetical protein